MCRSSSSTRRCAPIAKRSSKGYARRSAPTGGRSKPVFRGRDMPAFTVRINGASHQIDGAAGDTLLTVLRYELGLTGSKYGCGEGQCGACTVLVDGVATRSCITKLETLAGKNITTIEA